MSNVTVTTIVHNEAATIRNLLSQAKCFADEIIVFDQASTDGTPEIAKEYGAIVVPRPCTGSSDVGGHKQAIIDMVKTDWVFMLDGDEFLSEALLEVVIDRGMLNPAMNGWWFRRRWFVDGQETDILWPDYQHRLFRRTARWPEGIHTSPVSDPSDKCHVGFIIHQASSELILKRWKTYSGFAPGTASFNDDIMAAVKKLKRIE